MRVRESGCTQETAAAKAGISVRSGRRIEKGKHQPQGGRPHDWRTRADPLLEVWESELVPLLLGQPKLQAMTLYEYLQQKYPGKYGSSILRTLQRRVQQWKASSGPPLEVVFEQAHRPGVMGLSDFTKLKQVEITIAGKPFEHLLYHYRLAYSGWQYVQVILGGESFIALCQGLQNAIEKSGGCPLEHRSDSLSAAYRNLGGRTNEDLTQMYQRLCQHYRMRPTRNNRGIAHENGSIESPHGYFKNRLHQALLLRGSCDFDNIADYQGFINQMMEVLNAKICQKFQEEQPYLHSLPEHRYPDYEILSVKVTRQSTITVRCILYTVPSQLIGQRLTIHLYHDRLIGFVGNALVVELLRIHVPSNSHLRRARCVNYRHVIDSLRRKPRAFLHCSWQQDLLPNDNYRQLWQQMLTQLDDYNACRLMVEALYIAAKLDKEQAILTYLQAQLQADTLSLTALQQHFQIVNSPQIPAMQIQQHSLDQYDQLLNYVSSSDRLRHPASAPQGTQVVPHPASMAKSGAAGYQPAVVLHSISAYPLRVREYPALSITSATSAQGSATTPKIPL